MLTSYLTATRSLLQLPGTQSTSLYSDADLTRFINVSRGQLAGEAECIRVIGTVSTVIGQQPYNFSDINVGVASVTGVRLPLHVRSIRVGLGTGSIWIPGRPWEWFEFYELNNAAPIQGVPTTWSQYAQGAALTVAPFGGSFYVSPPPDNIYVLNCDTVCYPIGLIDDNTIEAIPQQWQDAVPFFAAYFALLSAETNARMADALTYYKMYNEFLQRARRQANASPNRWQYEQAQDPAQATKFGIKGGGT